MDGGLDYTNYLVKKLEKGPLQRFKNQNLLIKKFGESGLQVYKAVTGKRTYSQLQKDLGIEKDLFDQIMEYMKDNSLVELLPSVGEEQKAEAPEPTESEKTISTVTKEPKEQKKKLKLEELPPVEETPDESPPLEERPAERPSKEEEADEIKPIMSDEMFQEEAEPQKPAKRRRPSEGLEAESEEETPVLREESEDAQASVSDEIEPITLEESSTEAEPSSSSEYDSEPSGSEASAENETQETGSESEEQKPEEEIELSSIDEPQPEQEEETGLSPVEKIISDKYGDIGLQVYSLIDGQKTAEEIMHETGLTEPKLVEILDFMDEQGIIKLDYPKKSETTQSAFGGGTTQVQSYQTPPESARAEPAFAPMAESDQSLDEAKGISSPIEMPIKAPLDLVKSVQLKAKVMLKFSNRGGKVFEAIDGKNDVIDISMRLDMSLYEVMDIVTFMLENGMIITRPISRVDVRKKYGDDGYSVYKRYGKEGLMLYELIGKEMTVKQMADRVTRDKSKIIDMFVFIHQVLGIELPLDRNMLAKQLGIQ